MELEVLISGGVEKLTGILFMLEFELRGHHRLIKLNNNEISRDASNDIIRQY